jgi:hypothetical protein
VHGEHLFRLLVGGTLAELAAQNHATGFRSRETGFYSLAEEAIAALPKLPLPLPADGNLAGWT